MSQMCGGVYISRDVIGDRSGQQGVDTMGIQSTKVLVLGLVL